MPEPFSAVRYSLSREVKDRVSYARSKVVAIDRNAFIDHVGQCAV